MLIQCNPRMQIGENPTVIQYDYPPAVRSIHQSEDIGMGYRIGQKFYVLKIDFGLEKTGIVPLA